MQGAALAARTKIAAHALADLDRQLTQIDSTIDEAAKRGRTTTALTAIEALRKNRECVGRSVNERVRPLRTSKPSAALTLRAAKSSVRMRPSAKRRAS
jgi:phosphoserine phosphatase